MIRKMQGVAIKLLLLAPACFLTFASHFNGGTISWKPRNNLVEDGQVILNEPLTCMYIHFWLLYFRLLFHMHLLGEDLLQVTFTVIRELLLLGN